MVSAESLGASTLQRGEWEGAELLGSSWSCAQSSFFFEITKPNEPKECGRSQGWLVGSHGGVGKQY